MSTQRLDRQPSSHFRFSKDQLSAGIQRIAAIGTVGDLGGLIEVASQLESSVFATKANADGWPAYAKQRQTGKLDDRLFPDVEAILHQAGVTQAIPDRGFLLNMAFPLWIQMKGSAVLVEQFVEPTIQLFSELKRQSDAERQPVVLMSGLLFHLLASHLLEPFNVKGILLHPYSVFDTGLSQTRPQFIHQKVANMIGPKRIDNTHQLLSVSTGLLVDGATKKTIWKALPDQLKQQPSFQNFHQRPYWYNDPARNPQVAGRIYTNQPATEPKTWNTANHLYEVPHLEPQMALLSAELRHKIEQQRAQQQQILLITLGSMRLNQTLHSFAQTVEKALEATQLPIHAVIVNSHHEEFPTDDHQLSHVTIIPQTSYYDVDPDMLISHGGKGTILAAQNLDIPTSTLWFLVEQDSNSQLLGKKLVDSLPAASINQSMLTTMIRRLHQRTPSNAPKKGKELLQTEQQTHSEALGWTLTALQHILMNGAQ